jgi:tetratricopeptide (TPR) repeat protein
MIGVALAVVVAYWPALLGGFIVDDDVLVAKSDLAHASNGLWRMWFTTEPIDYWPVTNSSFWLEWRVWGMHAAGYHATNVLLHLAAAWLVWVVLRQLRIPGAAIAASLFALHPVNVESVAWIAQRKNVLSMVFLLLAIHWFIKDDDLRAGPVVNAGRRAAAPQVTARWYWLSVVAFVLAMLSKGSVAPLPGLLLVLIWWRTGRLSRTDFFRIAPFAAVAVGLTAVNLVFQAPYARHVTVVQRALSAGAIIWFYLYKSIVPVSLRFVYPQWRVDPTLWQWWLPTVAVIATTLILVRCRRHPVGRPLLTAWSFFCLALVPVLGFADTGAMKFSLVADHYVYIALLAVVTLAGAAVTRVTSGLAVQGTVRAAAVVVLVILGAATWTQAREYADAETMYRTMIRDDPSSWLAHNQLGSMMLDGLVSGSTTGAIEEFRAAIRANPAAIEAHFNLCEAYRRLQKLDDAVTECRITVALAPAAAKAHARLGDVLLTIDRLDEAQAEYDAALKQRSADPMVRVNLGDLFLRQGKIDQAIALYRQALELAPGLAIAHGNLGLALEAQGQKTEALAQLETAARLDPTLAVARAHLSAMQGAGDAAPGVGSQVAPALSEAQSLIDAGKPAEAMTRLLAILKDHPDAASAHDELGQAFGDMHELADAETEFRAAIRLAPNDATVHLHLGDLLQSERRFDDAIKAYRDAIRCDPRSAVAYNNLGVVQARAGEASAAIQSFEKALEIQPQYADAKANLERVRTR